MKKKLVMPFGSPREQYRSEATIIWCSDARFALSFQVFQEKMGWKNFDLLKIDGGARDLGTLGSETEREYVLGQIGKSLKLHHSPEIFLMVHYNCGAFNHEQMDPSDEEDRFFTAELNQAKNNVEQYLAANGLKASVRLLLLDFKNIYEVER